MKRPELDEAAGFVGIEDPASLPNRAAVIAAIEEATAARGESSKEQNEELATVSGLYGSGARVISVFGPFMKRTMIEISTDLAREIFDPQQLDEAGRTNAIDATLKDLAAIRQRNPAVADSALASSALRMAYEIEHPFNSATSKSQCAKELRQAMDRLLELAPPDEEGKGKLDAIKGGRAKRRSKA